MKGVGVTEALKAEIVGEGRRLDEITRESWISLCFHYYY